MKRKLYALLVALLVGLVHQANASRLIIIDPPPSYSTYDITSTSFGSSTGYSFNACDVPAEAPSGYLACFTGNNETGVALTSISIFISLVDPVNGPSLGCGSAGPTLDFFSDCSPDAPIEENGGYLLNFSDGSIPTFDPLNPNASVFTIAIDAPPSDFSGFEAIANAPEPSSIWLLSTGVLLSGFFFIRQRRTLDLNARA